MNDKTKNIKVSQLETNNGQIEGLPKNPRFIRDNRYKALVKSIEDAPEMLDYRTLMVVPHDKKFVVICGNMRFRACKEIGYKELPCYVLPEATDAKKLREYAMKDNQGYGDNDWDLIANEWDADELKEWGIETPEDWGGEEKNEEVDYSDKNQEIDVEEFGDKVVIKFEFETEEWQFVNSELQKIDANKELALLKLLNYNANE